MLKLATVFSGIGAIEHALDRMHVDHEIVFACDNGDVELEMPKVKVDIDAIETELKALKKEVKAFSLDSADEESVDYAAQLDVMLAGVEGELKKLLEIRCLQAMLSESLISMPKRYAPSILNCQLKFIPICCAGQEPQIFIKAMWSLNWCQEFSDMHPLRLPGFMQNRP